MILTTFVELRVVAGRTRMGHPHAITGRANANSHVLAMPMARCVVVLGSSFQNGMVVIWHGRGMVYVNHGGTVWFKWEWYNINPQWHNMGAEWERHGMSELSFRKTNKLFGSTVPNDDFTDHSTCSPNICFPNLTTTRQHQKTRRLYAQFCKYLSVQHRIPSTLRVVWPVSATASK
jgi:hypothetical protein